MGIWRWGEWVSGASVSWCVCVQVPWGSGEPARMIVNYVGGGNVHHLSRGIALRSLAHGLLGGGSAHGGLWWCSGWHSLSRQVLWRLTFWVIPCITSPSSWAAWIWEVLCQKTLSTRSCWGSCWFLPWSSLSWQRSCGDFLVGASWVGLVVDRVSAGFVKDNQTLQRKNDDVYLYL